ncbi:MAG: serine/threonine protein kinase [Pirellulaceae bacterium]|jgi:serine/threonine protein kinase|nr:serine/threonine protein kinase [Pirellulaceae bacterium]
MFRNLALLSGLATQEQIDEAIAAAQVQLGQAQAAGAKAGTAATQVEVDDNLLAALLVELGVITSYQARELKSGRSKFNLGPYTITDWIGQGGMGHVYKGVHQVMGRECALKVLPIHRTTPEAINNFKREVRTHAQLDHPNLVRAYDAGQDGNTHYLVVEYVPGTDLRKVVRSQGPLTQQQAASVILQAARGLDYAHKRGLIHRDVKPGNILVTPGGIAKVSDLGLAGFQEEGDADPRAGKIVGTADYLSPEQIRSPGDVTHSSDIYSLGCTLYYAVCGKVPFPGGRPADKARRHLHDTPFHPRRFAPDLDEEFVEVIADMMEKDHKGRIQSAAEVAARLEQFTDTTTPLGSPASIRSPWTAAPLPSAPDDDRVELGHETDGDDYSASAEGSASQMSQGTATAAAQDTTPVRPVRSLPLPSSSTPPAPVDAEGEQLSPAAIVALTLVISIPVAMVAGALIATLAMKWIGG